MVSVTFEIDTFDHKLCLYAFSTVKVQGKLLDGVALAEEERVICSFQARTSKQFECLVFFDREKEHVGLNSSVHSCLNDYISYIVTSHVTVEI